MQESIVFLVRVQCRRKKSSRSLSHLLMSFSYSVVRHCTLDSLMNSLSWLTLSNTLLASRAGTDTVYGYAV